MSDNIQPTDKKQNRGFSRLVRAFIETESSSGIIMILAAALAIILANSHASDWYTAFINTPLSIGAGESLTTEPLKVWVKDVLMVLFFFIIGMELKREMCEGFLKERSQILLPMAAAIGGMLAPSAIYLLFNLAHPENIHGWAIPAATDIAFALCVLMLVGKGVPPAAKIFLLAVAIFDDLGAILVIAMFYNTGLALTPLLFAALGVAVLWLMNRARIYAIAPYLMVGVYLWFCFYYSGIHTTIAGVILGMSIPMREHIEQNQSPLNTLMHFLHPWVSFIILPIFAFTSAGFSIKGISLEQLLSPVPLGIALGLFLGKPIGIMLASYALIKTRLARMPEGCGWLHLYAISILAGIGFTMSLFIGMLAFKSPELQEIMKFGVIGGSLLSVVWGALVMRIALKR
jgi:NhaA family Na+:H+ antiporter